MPPIPIEVFADVACPFTHVGLRRLVERRDALGIDVAVVVHAWPLELVNGEPIDPALVEEEVAALRDQVAPELFVGFDRTHFPATSLPALALASAAYRRDPWTGERVSLALRDALFERGLDISDPTVLADLAAEHDVDIEETDDAAVLADWRDGQRAGVVGSPFFVAGDLAAFCPSLHITRVDGRLRIAGDPDALEAFLAAAFG